MSNRYFQFSFLFILGISSCRRDQPPDIQPLQISGGEGGMYITNEGNFQFGNASVSYFEDGLNKEAVIDLFQPANNRPLGDVCQSMYFFNGLAYLVVNNSGKIEVVDENTFQSKATITGFNSPRYFLPVSNSKAYVTDLYDDAISIVDISNYQRVGEIPCPGWTEELLMIYGKVFVTNRSRSFLYVINSLNDALFDSIAIGFGANSLVEDRNGKLWVLCSGRQSTNTLATLQRINPVNNAMEATYTFANISDAPRRLDINGRNNTLYYLNGGVFQMEITATALPANALIPSDGRNFYGLGVHPESGQILVVDAIDYVQRGRIFRYQPNGTAIGSFLAGIIPGDFYFR